MFQPRGALAESFEMHIYIFSIEVAVIYASVCTAGRFTYKPRVLAVSRSADALSAKTLDIRKIHRQSQGINLYTRNIEINFGAVVTRAVVRATDINYCFSFKYICK